MQICTLEGEIEDSLKKIRILECEKAQFEREIEMSRDEAAGHINHIHSLKMSNFELAHGLEEAVSKGEMYKSK